MAGFGRVVSADGDAAALAALIAARADPARGALLHGRGAHAAGDLPGALAAAGVALREAILYEMAPAAALPEAAAAALAAGPCLILAYSPRGAARFAELAAPFDLSRATNAQLNHVVIHVSGDDLVGGGNDGWDVVLAGDVCYEHPMSTDVTRWLRALAADGTEVLMGDPGRNFLPADGLEEVGRHDVPTSLELEDREIRTTVVWRILPA